MDGPLHHWQFATRKIHTFLRVLLISKHKYILNKLESCIYQFFTVRKCYDVSQCRMNYKTSRSSAPDVSAILLCLPSGRIDWPPSAEWPELRWASCSFTCKRRSTSRHIFTWFTFTSWFSRTLFCLSRRPFPRFSCSWIFLVNCSLQNYHNENMCMLYQNWLNRFITDSTMDYILWLQVHENLKMTL